MCISLLPSVTFCEDHKAVFILLKSMGILVEVRIFQRKEQRKGRKEGRKRGREGRLSERWCMDVKGKHFASLFPKYIPADTLASMQSLSFWDLPDLQRTQQKHQEMSTWHLIQVLTLYEYLSHVSDLGVFFQWSTLFQKPVDESERGDWKSWLKAHHSENLDHGIQSHHFMANRWGNSGNSVRLYFEGGAPKSLQMVIAAMKLKDAYSLEGKLWPT